MEKFIMLDYQLLQRVDINLEEKVLVSYLQGWQSSNKVCFETQEEISTKLGISIRTLKRTIQLLKEKRIIFTSNDRKYLIPFNNRKALVLVDANNPYPTPLEETTTSTKETTSTKKITSNEVKSTEVIDTTTPIEISSENLNKIGKIVTNNSAYVEQEEIDRVLEMELKLRAKKYSEEMIGKFQVATRHLENGLFQYITEGNDGMEMKGLVSKLKKNNNQWGFDMDMEEMFLQYQPRLYHYTTHR